MVPFEQHDPQPSGRRCARPLHQDYDDSYLSHLTRRDLLKTAAGAGAAMLLPGCVSPTVDDAGLSAAVAILRGTYDDSVVSVIESGFALVPPPDVNGKRVLLKPNLVDLPRDNRPIYTHPTVIVAAAEAFRRRGAAEVIVAEGPALQRDAWQIVDAAGLTPLLTEHALPFVDLNLADVAAIDNVGGNLRLPRLYYSKTLLDADVIVSMPKMKVHHWAGVTLSLKNMIGTMPGHVYGWPRNIIHLRDLNNAVIDLNLTRSWDYAIIDGIVGMEGDGPIRGTGVDTGVLVMGDNPTAVDATAARVMDLRPESVVYLQRAAGLLGPVAEASIEQRGETITSVRRTFAVLGHQFALTL